jgi:hypothetical protein
MLQKNVYVPRGSLSTSDLTPPRNVGVESTIGPCAPRRMVRLWGSNESLVNLIVTLPAGVVSHAFENLSGPAGTASDSNRLARRDRSGGAGRAAAGAIPAGPARARAGGVAAPSVMLNTVVALADVALRGSFMNSQASSPQTETASTTAMANLFTERTTRE